ncbi:MAG: hypothetical protein QF389_09595, partial [Planctomycetota bacterium]|nr:hypothetical protein [Planctomycetota bacterium]
AYFSPLKYLTMAHQPDDIPIAKLTIIIVASLLPPVLGFANSTYFYAAVTLGIGFLASVLHFGLKRPDARARVLLWASLIYLPLLLLALWLS